MGIRDVGAVDFPGITWANFEATLRDYFELHVGYAPAVRLFDHHPIVADPRVALGLFYSTGLSSMALRPYYLRK